MDTTHRESDTKSKNKEILNEFVRFCEEHPELRFWQALAVWSRKVIYAAEPSLIASIANELSQIGGVIKDTYYWEGENGTS